MMGRVRVLGSSLPLILSTSVDCMLMCVPVTFLPSPLPHLPTASDRADALGKLGVSYGLGMVVGPYLGGHLTLHFSEEVAALVAGGLCVLGISFVWLFVPKSTKRASEKEKAPKGVWSTVNVNWREGGRGLGGL